jgi:4-hydroxybenzoate polyprenyltransferase
LELTLSPLGELRMPKIEHPERWFMSFAGLGIITVVALRACGAVLHDSGLQRLANIVTFSVVGVLAMPLVYVVIDDFLDRWR